jgi:hypothetical protein
MNPVPVRRGRPKGSRTRDRVGGILSVIERGTGYDVYRIYREVYGSITSRSIYYNLHQGVLLDDFELDEITVESGEYSWGGKAEKKYYKPGRKAKHHVDDDTKQSIARSWSRIRGE